MTTAAIAEVDAEVDKTQTVYTASLAGQCLAEFVGTFIVILIGDGAVAAAVMTNQLDGWGVAMMWGLAVTFGIYVAGPVSGAHFNPAVTITMAVFRGFPRSRVLPFILSQIAGAFTGAAAVYAMWHGYWPRAVEKLGVVVGEPGSQKLMAIFSCFYPSPGGIGVDASAFATVSASGAFFIEVLLTMFLLLMIFALTEPGNTGMPQAGLGPLFIGLTVTAIVGVGGSLTMDAVNPVRDFGPRLFAYVIGFGEIAFPGPRGNEWWLYIVAPIIGGLIGAAVYRYLVRRFLPPSAV
ncbi:MAG TPA: MIP/aquaporin family protein [Blastocatellia bacterium]|jgi:Glycerol uptake facilitator and related permeases (Major Intrinsic Protein Family)|nr:MIP/aquaporin family protein [Blastocatellia bacterium]